MFVFIDGFILSVLEFVGFLGFVSLVGFVLIFLFDLVAPLTISKPFKRV